MCNGAGSTGFIAIVSHKEKVTKQVSLAGMVVKTKAVAVIFPDEPLRIHGIVSPPDLPQWFPDALSGFS